MANPSLCKHDIDQLKSFDYFGHRSLLDIVLTG